MWKSGGITPSILNLDKLCYSHQIKKEEIFRICSTYGINGKACSISVQKPEGKRPLWACEHLICSLIIFKVLLMSSFSSKFSSTGNVFEIRLIFLVNFPIIQFLEIKSFYIKLLRLHLFICVFKRQTTISITVQLLQNGSSVHLNNTLYLSQCD
jgi:hypothetical protein